MSDDLTVYYNTVVVNSKRDKDGSVVALEVRFLCYIDTVQCLSLLLSGC
jgi:hypothetical protein